MYELISHNDLVIDLKRLMAVDSTIVYRTRELLDELKGNQDLLDRLSQPGYGGTLNKPHRHAQFNVKMWFAAQDQGQNLWRLRDYTLASNGHEYRLIYAFFPEKKKYFIMALVEKAQAYDISTPVSKRIFASVDRLGYNAW